MTKGNISDECIFLAIQDIPEKNIVKILKKKYGHMFDGQIIEAQGCGFKSGRCSKICICIFKTIA
jgi:hypothetical protein